MSQASYSSIKEMPFGDIANCATKAFLLSMVLNPFGIMIALAVLLDGAGATVLFLIFYPIAFVIFGVTYGLLAVPFALLAIYLVKLGRIYRATHYWLAGAVVSLLSFLLSSGVQSMIQENRSWFEQIDRDLFGIWMACLLPSGLLAGFFTHRFLRKQIMAA